MAGHHPDAKDIASAVLAARLLLLGLLAPPLAVRLGYTGDAAIPVAIGLAALLVLQLWLNARIRRYSD